MGGGVRIHFGCLASRCSVLGSRRVPVLIIGIVIESPTGGVTTYMLFIIQPSAFVISAFGTKILFSVFFFLGHSHP